MGNSGTYSGKYRLLFAFTAARVHNYLHLSFTFSKMNCEVSKECSHSHSEHLLLKLKGHKASFMLKLITSLGFGDKWKEC